MTRIMDAASARMNRIRRGEAERGFTLIELLVVVIIIGILAAIAIPVFLNQRTSAWKASVESDVHNAQLAIETYATANSGKYPTVATSTDVSAVSGITNYTPSADNSVKVVSTASGYTITGKNSNVTGTGSTRTYSSSTGSAVWG